MSSTSGISFSGLGSGIDTSSIVDQLIALQRVPVQNVQTRQDREKTRQQALQDIASRVTSLRTAAEALTSATYWKGAPHATTGDQDSYGVTADAGAVKSSYTVKVNRLASADVHVQTISAGVRQFGATYSASGVFASGSTLLTGLTGATGTSLGVTAGQTITLTGTAGGSPVTGTFTVAAGSTLESLRAFVQTTIPGSDVKIGSGGRLTVVSPPGTDQEVTGLGLSTGGAAPLFDSAFASSTQTVAASGVGTVQANDTLHITAGTLQFDVAVTAGMSMQQLAAAITAANGGVSAAVANGRLRIAGTATGAAEQVTITSTGTAAADLGLANISEAADAELEVDGVTYSSASNEVKTVIPGATVTLKRAGSLASTATTDPTYVDKDDATAKVKALIDQYNSTIDLINTKANEKNVVNATTTTDKLKGTLFASSTLRSMRSSLQNAFADVIAGLVPGKSLASDAGISTGTVGTGLSADALAGKLTFDRDKFGALFDSDREAARAIFASDGTTSATDGLAQRIADLSKSFTQTGGLLQAAIDGSSNQIKQLQDQIDRMNTRIDAEQTRLKTQFTAMETAIAQLQSAQAGISSLNSSSSSNS